MKWVDVLNFESKYEVSDEGVVRSKPRSIIRRNGRPLTVKGVELSYSTNLDGYFIVELHDIDGNNKPKLVHKIVWESFNGKVPSGFEIGHKDCNSQNNELTNLYLCTHKENCNHPITRKRQSDRMKGNSISKGLKAPNRIPIVCLDLNYNLIKEYECITDVLEDGFSVGNVSTCCQNKYGKRGNVTKGRIFMTKEEYIQKNLEGIATS